MILDLTTYQGTTVTVDTERKVVTTQSRGDMEYTGVSTHVVERTPVYIITTAAGPIAIEWEDGKRLMDAICPQNVKDFIDRKVEYLANYDRVANS